MRVESLYRKKQLYGILFEKKIETYRTYTILLLQMVLSNRRNILM